MSEDTKTVEAEEKPVEAKETAQKKTAPLPETFKIKNIVRRQKSRLRRTIAPGRQRFKQYVAGRRLLRNQTMTLTADEMQKNAASIMAGVKCGALEIVDPDGWKFHALANGDVMKVKGNDRMKVEGKDKAAKKPAPKADKPADLPAEIPVPVQPDQKAVKAEKEVVEKEVVEKEVIKDDLTQLQGVGAGRARKLEAKGISSFKKLASSDPAVLAELLGANVTADQAAELISAAKEKVGG